MQRLGQCVHYDFNMDIKLTGNDMTFVPPHYNVKIIVTSIDGWLTYWYNLLCGETGQRKSRFGTLIWNLIGSDIHQCFVYISNAI